jgi:hypothetical protein
MTEPTNPEPYPSAPASPSAYGAYGAPMPPVQPGSVAPLGPPPSSVVNAVRLMFLGAALSALGIIVLLTAKSSMRTAIANKNPNYDAHKLDTAVNAAIAISVVFGIIFLVLYVLLALQVRKGKNWARIVTLVITAIGVLSTLSSYAQPAPAIVHIFGTISGLLDLAIIVLLVQSKQYFRRVVQ